MRFDQWHLPAFGPFTDFRLDFPVGEADLQILYGPNEAGKTSLLRAVRQLLFGIEARTEDNFLHEYKRLRVGATLTNQAGVTQAFYRRKSQQHSLLDGAEQPLPDHGLEPFLGAVNAGYFTNMFGLTAAQLREGAQALLQGEGDLGKALFSASLGGTPVQKTIASLQADADKIFKPRARVGSSLGPAIERYAALKKSLAAQELKPQTWAALEADLQAARQRRDELQSALGLARTQIEWLRRAQDALPAIRQWHEVTSRLQALAGLPDVSETFVADARTAQQQALSTETERLRLEQEIAALREQASRITPSPEVLQRAASIDELAGQATVVQEKKLTQTQLQLAVATAEHTLRQRLQDLGLSQNFAACESLRLTTAQRFASETAAQALVDAERETQRLQLALETAGQTVARVRLKLEALPQKDLSALRLALSAAQPASAAAAALPLSQANLAKIQRSLTQTLRHLPGAPAETSAVRSLPVPGKQTIQGHEKLLAILRQRLETLALEHRDCAEKHQAAQMALAKMERRGTLPNLSGLTRARAQREEHWAELAGKLAAAQFPDPRHLAAFPNLVHAADDLADRLREEATAVAEAEQWREQCASLQEKLTHLEQAMQAESTALDEAQKAWKAAWEPCGLNPQSPEEMLEWRSTWEKFLEQAEELTAETARSDDTVAIITTTSAQLRAMLGTTPETGFPALVEQLQQQISDADQAAGERRTLSAELAQATEHADALHHGLARQEQTLLTCQSQWREVVKSLALGSQTTPQLGQRLFAGRQETLTLYDAWKKDHAQLAGLQTSLDEHARAVAQLASALQVQEPTPETQLAALVAAGKSAREASVLLNDLETRCQERLLAAQSAKIHADQAAESLREIHQLACVQDRANLEEVLAACERRQQLRQQQETLRQALHGAARGEALEDFIPRVQAEAPATLASRLEAAATALSHSESDLQAAEATVLELHRQKTQIEKSDGAAADERQQLAIQAATIQVEAARYARLSLALSLLKGQVETFRKQHQGPMLERASRIFSNLTNQAFLGLRSEWQADDQPPILVGEKPGDQLIPPQGMSEGTQDQLYLSLRLAALELYLEQHEPMPLILDDLLSTYDDSRAAALLRQLARTARRSQVIVFTHHQHLRQLCEETLGAGQFHWHPLTATERAGIPTGL